MSLLDHACTQVKQEHSLARLLGHPGTERSQLPLDRLYWVLGLSGVEERTGVGSHC